MTDEEKIVKAKSLIEELLAQEFRDELQFQVSVVREFNDVGQGDGSPYLRIRISVDGDFQQFEQLLNRKKWAAEFGTDMGDTFARYGIEDEPLPVTTFFSKAE